LRGAKASRVSGRILTATKLEAHNTFERPENVKVADFSKAVLSNNALKVEMPAKSVVVLNIK
jgi:alpha-N-arabinofuranosidase